VIGSSQFLKKNFWKANGVAFCAGQQWREISNCEAVAKEKLRFKESKPGLSNGQWRGLRVTGILQIRGLSLLMALIYRTYFLIAYINGRYP
jgi:hypothetical protein